MLQHPHSVVAEARFERATSRLWAWRATNCSTPRCCAFFKQKHTKLSFGLLWKNVYLLSGVIQNQYWRHLDPAAQTTARSESFSCTRMSQFIEISEMAKTSRRSLSTEWFRILSVSSPFSLTLISFNWTYNQRRIWKFNSKKVGVYAGVEPANYSLYIGSSLPFE